MWDKISLFGWGRKTPSVQPVQREVSVTLTNGDRRETIQRSPSGTKLTSMSSSKQGLDDDNSSEASTSLNFGLKTGASGRRNSSYSLSRDPLDLPTWSNVTSPGFTSRVVQQASGNSPLKEFNDSLSHSPFRHSPHRNLGLGELPFVSYSRKSSSPAVFPARASSLRSGVSSSIYNRDRRRNARQGQTFVRIAPLDPTVKTNVNMTRQSSSPPHGMPSNGGSFIQRTSPRGANETYRPEGVGGIPQQELAMRFTKLWPTSPGGSFPGPGRPSSPTSPSNIMDALSGRKRTREPDPYYPPNATPPSVSPPSKISIGIGDTPVRPQVPKRVKFLSGHDGHDRPMMVGYHPGLGGGDSEHLSSESILEQMNQTEKRFLPDSAAPPFLHKKGRMSGSEDQSLNLDSSQRKRRSHSNNVSAVDDEPRGEKQGRFCTCNECYAEAAGGSASPSKLNSSGSLSLRHSDEKSTNTAESKSKETCDKGVSTSEFDRGAYFREVFKKADLKKPTKVDDIDDLTPYGKTVITKEMYARDKQKRIERYYRILKMKPPGGSIFDPCPESVTQANSSQLNSSKIGGLSNDTIDGTSSPAGFNFGSPAPPVSAPAGISFGKQTSPVTQTNTTTACSTISSPTTAPSMFGSSTTTVPTLTPQVGFSSGFGSTTATPIASNAASNPPSNIPTFGSPSVTVTKPSSQPSATMTLTTATSTPTLTASSAGNAGGFSFSGTPATTTQAPASTSSTPSFGFGSTTSAPASTTTSTAPTFGSGSTATAGFGFGTSSANKSDAGGGLGFKSSAPVSTQAPTPASGGFSFGSSNTPATTASIAPAVTNVTVAGIQLPQTTLASTAGTNSFSFGQPAAQSTPAKPLSSGLAASATPSATSAGGFSFGSAATPNTTQSALPTFGSQPPAFGASTTTTSNTPLALTTSAPAPSPFGLTAPPATTAQSTFGNAALSVGNNGSSSSSLPAFGTTAAQKQVSFSAGTNPILGGTKPATPAATGNPGGFNFGTTTPAKPATTTISIFPQSPSTTASGTASGSSNSVFGANPGGSFSFGGSSGVATPSQSNTAPGAFSFKGAGQPATSTPAPAAGAFSFGQTPAAPATTAAPAASGPGVFQFGQPAAAPAASTVGGTPAPAFQFGQQASQGFSAGNNNSSGFGFGASAASSPATTTTSVFGSSMQPSTAPGTSGTGSVFGGNTSSSGGFGFGSSAVASPPAPSASNAFAFGGSAPAAAPSFAFGQASSAPAPSAPAPSGAFQFGQAAASPAGAPGAAPFQFGQQAAQGVPGGFNFSAAAPAPSPGGSAMFSMGSASTAPRRRDAHRRLRR